MRQVVKNALGYRVKTNQIQLSFFFIRNTFENGISNISYMSTKNQVADICTKSFNEDKRHCLFERFSIIYAHSSVYLFDFMRSETEILLKTILDVSWIK